MTYADVAYKVTQLGANSLKDFKHFKNFVTIPDAVTSIGNNAFRGSNLIRMYVESGVGSFLPMRLQIVRYSGGWPAEVLWKPLATNFWKDAPPWKNFRLPVIMTA